MSDSDRLRDAQAALDDARRDRAERPPDLFSERAEIWERPKSLTPQQRERALEVVRQVALERDCFTVAEVLPRLTEQFYDLRAIGAVLRSAARKGWIEKDGYVVSGTERHGRPIVRWRSRIYAKDGRRSPEAPVRNDTERTDSDVRN